MAPAFLHDRAVKVALVLLPVVVPAVYLYRFSHNVSSKTTSTTGRRSADAGKPTSVGDSPRDPVSLPAEVKDASRWEVAYERIVSHPIPASSLAFPITGPTETDTDRPSALMRAYTSAAQAAFSSTPQAVAMRAAIGDAQAKRSFDVDWIRDLSFGNGDLVNGAYRVVYHGHGQTADSERVELAIEAPPSYKGHVPRGLIASEIQKVGDEVVFVNETWMWRKPGERKTLIEAPLPSWFHRLTVGWLVLKAMGHVMRS